jgi:hypothetical protein
LVDSICHNRYGNELMFSVRLVAKERPDDYNLKTPSVMPLSNPIIFVPETELSEDEALELVLRDLCGVDISSLNQIG